MFKIAITNRRLTDDLLRQIEILHKSDYEYIILREKDLHEEEYIALAKGAIEISDKIILHSFIDAAMELDYKKIHLPYPLFEKNISRVKDFDIIGVSTHSADEALMCQKYGASYITYSHIFETDCKKGIAPKGLDELEKICRIISIPVYALGGINEKNAQSCIEVGAFGVCMMSESMKLGK